MYVGYVNADGHPKIAVSHDHGLHWSKSQDGGTPFGIQNAESDPVQRGCTWHQGGNNPCRNLLDFNDLTVDRFGRVLVAYADGCTGSCVTDPTQNATRGPASAQDAVATIARQTGGRGLFAAFDGTHFGTNLGDDRGGGKLCFGDAATAVSGDPDCSAREDRQ